MIISLVNLCSDAKKEMPPLSLMTLSRDLKNAGLEHIYAHDILVHKLDISTAESHASTILLNEPDVICISLYTDLASYAKHFVAFLNCISKGHALIVAGGPHATCAPESCADCIKPDVVVRGPGEGILPLIINLHAKGMPITGSMVTNHNECAIIDNRDFGLNSIKSMHLFPDRRILQLADYSFPYTISTARGCPGRCTFCSSPTIHRNGYFPRPISSVKAELEQMKSDYQIEHVNVIDDTFTHNFGRTSDICDCLSSIDCKWFCESRIDSVCEEKLRLMADSGCSSIQFGIECFDKNMLKRIGKNVNPLEIARIVETASNLGINVSTSLMIGLPGDSIPLIKKRVNQAVALYDYGAKIVEFGSLKLYPGTAIYINSKRLGYLDCKNWWENDMEQEPYFATSLMSKEEIKGMLLYAVYKTSTN